MLTCVNSYQRDGAEHSSKMQLREVYLYIHQRRA